jgi:hypothetical protein
MLSSWRAPSLDFEVSKGGGRPHEWKRKAMPTDELHGAV